MELESLDLIFNRRSVRDYTSKVVNREQLTLLMKAGMAAPTAVNMQPWEFIAVDDKETISKLAEILPYAKMLYRATAAIVVCGDSDKAFAGSEKYCIVDISAATENMLLAAEAIGLGAVWTAVYPEKERMKEVCRILSIPETIIPLNVIPIGYPADDSEPKDKFKKEKIHWNKW